MKEEREKTKKEISWCYVPGEVTPKMRSYKYQKKYAEDNKQFWDTYASTKANMDNWWGWKTGRTRSGKPAKVAQPPEKQSQAGKTKPEPTLSKRRKSGPETTKVPPKVSGTPSPADKPKPAKPQASKRCKARPEASVSEDAQVPAPLEFEIPNFEFADTSKEYSKVDKVAV